MPLPREPISIGSSDGGDGRDVATFRASIGCGAEVVAAVLAEADAVAATGAEDGAKTKEREDGEEESEEPVWEVNEVKNEPAEAGHYECSRSREPRTIEPPGSALQRVQRAGR